MSGEERRVVDYERVEVRRGEAGLVLYRPDSNGNTVISWLTDAGSPIPPMIGPLDRALTIARLRAWADLLEGTPTP